MSQFEKVDVLGRCLTGPKTRNEIVEEISVMRLPLEIIIYVLEILDYNDQLRPKFLRISKLFYNIVLPMIYRHPKLKATNFFAFVDTISSNKNIGNFIKVLNLSYIIQTGKNAFIAKLLKRSRKHLEVFVAPQTSFGLGPLIALKNCERLKVLDLRLVSETLNLVELFKSISKLNELTHLSFPRSSIELYDYSSIAWPPKLSFLRISGGVTDLFLMESHFPSTIRQLEFAHCPSVKSFGLHSVLFRLGANLTSFKVQYPMPTLEQNSLDRIFNYCPNLIVLEVAVDYVSSSFFDEENLSYLPYKRPLKTLYIDSSGMLGTTNRLDPIDLAVAINEERLPLLKNLQCTAKLGWDPDSEYVSFIADSLDERGGGLYIGY
ncbi:uncharacterized protein PRCAT00004373001 [Priceomyces carsonii]|uniref:uncharacterized protein n=1 Tax=Priceomyces carsonii TaxID=28549 RepID=UPI002EDA9FBD|nr:unnamed protein product [Priceomyces carsonii]